MGSIESWEDKQCIQYVQKNEMKMMTKELWFHHTFSAHKAFYVKKTRGTCISGTEIKRVKVLTNTNEYKPDVWVICVTTGEGLFTVSESLSCFPSVKSTRTKTIHVWSNMFLLSAWAKCSICRRLFLWLSLPFLQPWQPLH